MGRTEALSWEWVLGVRKGRPAGRLEQVRALEAGMELGCFPQEG